MPSFDIVSEIDLQEVRNAVENANREVETRWDFRQVVAKIEFNDKKEMIKVSSESDFQVNQLMAILTEKLIKRNIDMKSIEMAEQIEHSGKMYSKEVTLKQGIETLMAKKLVKLIKESKLKVQTQIQGDQLRVTGKSRDDLQQVISLVKGSELEQSFQFTNFRD